MRTWRVGTFSMGAALLALGILLLVSNFEKDISTILLSWWPIIFIILGIEIIVHLFMRKEENPVIKYDVFSILFVAFLGTVGLILAGMSTFGITDEVQAAITSKEMTFDLPEYNKELEDGIKKIVVEDSYQQLTIESSISDNVSLFGTYRTSAGRDDGAANQSIDHFASIKSIGDTLYISLKELPRKTGWHSDYTTMKATLIIPSNVKLEVRGGSDQLILRPNGIGEDWVVENAATVSVYATDEDDLTIQALEVHHLQSYGLDWTLAKETNGVEELSDMLAKDPSGKIELGSGKNKVDIIRAYEVSAYLN